MSGPPLAGTGLWGCKNSHLSPPHPFGGGLTFASLSVRLQHEAHRTAAVGACRCVMAFTVAASVVDSTSLC